MNSHYVGQVQAMTRRSRQASLPCWILPTKPVSHTRPNAAYNPSRSNTLYTSHHSPHRQPSYLIGANISADGVASRRTDGAVVNSSCRAPSIQEKYAASGTIVHALLSRAPHLEILTTCSTSFVQTPTGEMNRSTSLISTD